MKFGALASSAVVVLVASISSGCAGYAPNERFIGMSREQVIAELGAPRPRPENLATAKRLDFPRGPAGKHTYSVYFNESGQASGYRQLLTEENFQTIVPGLEVREVIERIGIATDTFVIARNRGYVWNYRYENTQCRWFQIEFTAEDKVRSAGYGFAPECRPRPRMVR